LDFSCKSIFKRVAGYIYLDNFVWLKKLITMKISIRFIAIILTTILLSSCEVCIKCEIKGSKIDDVYLIDSNNVVYNEFCGSPSEAEAFENDVKYEAETRTCKIYKIDRMDNGLNEKTFTYCGGNQHHQAFMNGLEVMIDTLYTEQGVDVRLYVDTTISNPATWQCK
jgi:hypothetical protein